MKPTLFLASLFLFITSLKSQDLTVREVFDYEVGDEFHFSRSNVPPNAHRFVVIGKYHSANQDTVFYVEKHDSYTSYVVYTPSPHLEYSIGNKVDTVSYSNLDASISSLLNLNPMDSCDQIKDSVYSSSEYCNRRTYQYNSCIQCCFEGQQTESHYTEGLGQPYYYFSYPAENYSENFSMFYYKKGIDSCGTADRSYYTAINEQFLQQISTSPNPAKDHLKLEGFTGAITVNIRNIAGQLIQSAVVSHGILSLSNLMNGVYLLELTRDGSTRVIKLVISNN